MTKSRPKISAVLERLRESLWFIPGLMVLGAGSLATFLSAQAGPAPRIPLLDLLLPSEVDAARGVLQVVAGTVITVTSVVFSLTVVALQITAGNYSPRALRTFLRDFGTQVVLGTFLATFAFTYVLLLNVRPTEAGGRPWGPEMAFLPVPIFVAGSLAALVFFIHHVTRSIRVDLLMGDVLAGLLGTIEKTHGRSRQLIDGHVRDLVPPDAVEVSAPSSGFVRSIGAAELTSPLEASDTEVAFRPTVGDHVLEGSTIAWVWSRRGGSVSAEIRREVVDAVEIDRQRPMKQDVAFGIRQLVDIAVRALSPAMNDPNTAVGVIHHLGVAYRRLLDRGTGPVAFLDGSGERRATVPYPTFEEYLHIAVQQISHYGRADLMIVLRLLRTLGELKSLAGADDRGITDLIDWVLADAERGLETEANRETARMAARDAREGTAGFRHYTAAG